MDPIALTRDQFTAAVTLLHEKYDVVVSGDEGTIEHSGVTATYSYDGTALTLAITKKPWYVSEGYVEGQILAWFGQHSSGISVAPKAIVALVLCFSLMFGLTGCTVKQQADAKAVVAKIVSYEPEVVLAVDALSTTLATFAPADAALISAAQQTFDAAFAALKVACDDYTATPNDGTLASISTALQQVLAVNANQFLAATHITNPVSVAAAKTAIVAVREVLLLMDGALQTTQTPAQNAAVAEARTLKLRDIAPYLDKHKVEMATGHNFHVVYAYETSQGF
ncbi:hypothetical protein FTO74_14330 [Granulicella sp. WH15]|uniref:hypothetical protein n=1 Tax=Granulicella sp. WH15 TaxID=2602070 RepID=UPI00136771EA|nr:hypothetical protein [Granulicella sp. WH15]QHN04409.1 hypothetical protein FTO74_14330 [Granulicella sp. WH15]